MKKLTRKTLKILRDELGFVDQRKKGEPLTADDYHDALFAAAGNRVIASMLLGVSEGTLRTFISRNPELMIRLKESFPTPGMVLAAEPIDPDLVKAELDAGNGSMALIARNLGHGRTSIKKYFDRNPDLKAQWQSLNAEV